MEDIFDLDFSDEIDLSEVDFSDEIDLSEVDPLDGRALYFSNSDKFVTYIQKIKIDYTDYFEVNDYEILFTTLDGLWATAPYKLSDTVTGDEFVDWLCTLVGSGSDLGKYIRTLIQKRANKYFDKDYPSIYDLVKTVPALSGKGYGDKTKYIGLLKKNVVLYDRGPHAYELPNDLRRFRVQQRADVTIPALKRRLVAVQNFINPKLEIKESGVPRAGYGLFAKAKFHKGNLITLYDGIGSNMNPSGGLPAKDQSEYVFELTPKSFIDGERGFRITSVGRWPNHSNNPNAELDTKPLLEQIVPGVWAIRVIEPGEEIFVGYGEKFFNEDPVHSLWGILGKDSTQTSTLFAQLGLPSNIVIVQFEGYDKLFHAAIVGIGERHLGIITSKAEFDKAKDIRAKYDALEDVGLQTKSIELWELKRWAATRPVIFFGDDGGELSMKYRANDVWWVDSNGVVRSKPGTESGGKRQKVGLCVTCGELADQWCHCGKVAYCSARCSAEDAFRHNKSH